MRITPLVLFFALLTACDSKIVSVRFAETKLLDGVSGEAEMFKKNSSFNSTMTTCTTATATLFQLDDAGQLIQPSLGTTSIDENGKFLFKTGKKISLNSSSTKYIIKAEGCDSTYYRPVTKMTEQNITTVSTLVSLAALESADPNKRIFPSMAAHEIEETFKRLDSSVTSTSLISTIEAIIADAQLNQQFQALTHIVPEKVKETPPAITVTVPTQVSEGSVASYSVITHHWNPSYETAYEWILDGSVASTSSTFVYTPGKNSQGTHSLTLKVGSKNGSGNFDTTKTFKSESISLIVADAYPPIAPSISLVGQNVISSHDVSLSINTGAAKIHCATFSSLGISESSTPPSTFNYSCSDDNTQPVTYSLADVTDGTKILYLWAKDAAGTISSLPTTASVIIDTAPPTVLISTAPTSLNNLTSQAISFNGSDANGISGYECKLDAGAFTACSSPISYSGLSAGSHTFQVRSVDIANTPSTVATATWNIDLTAPTVTISSAPNTINNQTSSTFIFSAVDTGGGTVASYQCKMDSGSFASCASPAVYNLGAGAHTFAVRAIDIAGNTSGALSASFTIDLSAPTVTMISQPGTVTNATSAHFEFSGSDTGGGGITSYQCSLNNASFATCTSPVNHSGLAAGVHSFQVKAIDSAGNTGAPITYSWTVDLTTPIPTISASPLLLTNIAATSFSFAAAPPPGGSIIGYECQLDGATFASCTSPHSLGSLTEGSHNFKVRSIDNNNARSSAVSYDWKLDLTEPTLTIGSRPSVLNNLTSVSFTFAANDNGGAAVGGYECQLDSSAYGACSSPISYTVTAGSHIFSVRAADTAGNMSSVQTASWTTDLTAPSVAISANPNAVTNSTSANFTFTGTDSGGGSVASYECSVDNGAYATCTSVKNITSLSQGAHNFAVRATDSTGNTGTPATYDWIVDLTAPTVTLTAKPNADSNVATPSFSFTAVDNGGGSVSGFSCSLDGASFTSCTSPHTTASLANGSHNFKVRANDTAGNVSAEVTHTWNVDVTAPVPTITMPAANGSVVPLAQVGAFSVSGACENGLTVSFSGVTTDAVLCAGGTWSLNLDLSSKAEGSQTLSVNQIDAAGNSTTVSRTFIKDTTEPVLTITSIPSSAQRGSGTATIQFTATESNISTSQTFTVSYSSDNGATWTTAGTVSSTSGPLSAQAFNYSMTFPSVNTSQFRVRVSGPDSAGNVGTSAASSPFIVDSVAPSLTSLTINGGATVALSPTLTMAVNATDTLAGIAGVRFADAVGVNCQNAYADNNWNTFTNAGGTQTYSYVTGFSNGTHKVCAWAKDVAGNVSQITANSNSGTVGTETASINLDQGSPPIFTALSVTNNNSASANYGKTIFANGDQVKIEFTVTDDSALATNPISIFVSTDNSTYTQIATSAVVGSPGSAQTSWTKVYTGYTATTANFFKIRLVALDANGNTSQTHSASLNTGKWSLFAGNDDNGNGSSALSAKINMTSSARNQAMVNSKNQIFLATTDGIRKIDPTTGNISTYLACGTTAGIPGTISGSTRLPSCSIEFAVDGDELYVMSGNNIYLVNTITDSIKHYAGGGTTVSTADPTQLYIWTGNVAMTIDTASKDIYLVNLCDTADKSGQSSVQSIKIQRITQNTSTKTAVAVSDFAGNCAMTAPVDGADKLSSGLYTSVYRTAGGGLLYIPSTQTLYFNPNSSRPLKFINGKVYTADNFTYGMYGMVYNSAENRVYTTSASVGVYYFTPNSNNDYNESYTKLINSETSCTLPTCRNDGTSLSSSGVYAGSVFLIGGKLGLIDGSSGPSRVRVLDSGTNTLQTIAGTDRFAGEGGDRTLARFHTLGYMVYKDDNTGMPAGLYVSDRGASRLLYFDLGGNSLSVVAGSGVSAVPTLPNNFGTSIPLGTQNYNIWFYAFNSLGLPTFHSRQMILNTKSDLSLEHFIDNTGGSSLSTTDGYTGTARSVSDGESGHGMIYDSSYNLYFGGYRPLTNENNKIMVRKSNGATYTVIGKTLNAVSPDCTTPGCALTSSIYSSISGASLDDAGGNAMGKYDTRFNANEGRLLFAEGNYIRYVNRAYDNTQSTLNTLKAEGSSTALNFTRSIGAFAYTYVGATEQIDKIYYVSGDGKLYCQKVSTGADASCNNTALGPPSGIGTFGSSKIAMDNNGNIYVSNSSAIYKYSP